MRALFINNYGSTDSIQLDNTSVNLPEITSHELLVKVHACALNPVDYKVCHGDLKDLLSVNFPYVFGIDVSGVITKLGASVKNLSIGDEVFFANELALGGGCAEYCAVNANLVAKKPDILSHVEAAALPVIGLTVVQCLRDYANIKANDKILIHAGAGGVGSLAIQYAKVQGAKVFTTARKVNHQDLFELGADHCIDYEKEDFVAVCESFGKMDIVLETVGGLNYPRSILACKSGGSVPCIINHPDLDTLNISQKNNVKTDFILMDCNSQDLQEISNLIINYKIKPIINKVIDLNNTLEELKKLESGKSKGKVVIEYFN